MDWIYALLVAFVIAILTWAVSFHLWTDSGWRYPRLWIATISPIVAWLVGIVAAFLPIDYAYAILFVEIPTSVILAAYGFGGRVEAENPRMQEVMRSVAELEALTRSIRKSREQALQDQEAYFGRLKTILAEKCHPCRDQPGIPNNPKGS